MLSMTIKDKVNEIKELYPIPEDKPAVILADNCTNTVAEYTELIAPFILAGYCHVAWGTIDKVALITEPVGLTYEQIQKLREYPPSSIVDVGDGIEVVVYYAEIY